MKLTLSPIVTEINGKLDRLSIYKLNGQHVTRGERIFVDTPSEAQASIRRMYGILYERYSAALPMAKLGMVAGGDKQRFGSWAWAVQQQLAQVMADEPYIWCDGSLDTIPVPVNLRCFHRAAGKCDIFWNAYTADPDLRAGYQMWREGSRYGVESESTSHFASDGSITDISINNFHNYEVNLYFFKVSKTDLGRSAYYWFPKP